MGAALLALVVSAALAGAQSVPSRDDVANLPQEETLSLGVGDSVANPVPDWDGRAGFVDVGSTMGGSVAPRAKAGSPWVQIGGASFAHAGDQSPESTDGMVVSSRYDDNFFAVAFRGAGLGLVGGSTCGDPGDPSDFQKSSPEGEADCRPVMYRSSVSEGGNETWERVALPGGVGDPGGRERPGYVGAIAWIDGTRALAVGGTGTFPRREAEFGKRADGSDCPSTAGEGTVLPYGAHCDQAGRARVWLYDDGRWRELTEASGDLPLGMRGLTAVDFKPDHSPEIGFAGGLGQIWRWRDGQFDSEPIDMASPESELANASKFFFRVRALRFVDWPGHTQIYAVTSGCCAPPAQPGELSTDAPAVLAYTEAIFYGPPRWYLNPGRRSVAHPDAPNPVSLYSVTASLVTSNGFQKAGWLESAGGPPVAGEARSRVLQFDGSNDPRGPSWGGGESAVSPNRGVSTAYSYYYFHGALSTARLVAGDGDQLPMVSGNDRPGDGVPDWSVGELRSHAVAGRGRQGVGFQTGVAKPDCYRGPNQNDAVNEVVGGKYTPTDRQTVDGCLASFDWLLSSYGLNAIDIVGATGKGFAVGDHGAIFQLNGRGVSGGGVSEPAAPVLAASSPKPLAEDPSIQPPPPAAGRMAGVPPLVAQPMDHAVGLVPDPGGSPDMTANAGGDDYEDVSTVVMSRDGSEGWAVGTHPDVLNGLNPYATAVGGRGTLFHYAAGTWTRCDPRGVPGQLEADPACASVADIQGYLAPDGARRSLKIVSAARVPTERDPDPSRHDDFEVVAVALADTVGPGGHGYAHPGDTQESLAVLRYRDGRWRFEDAGMREASRLATPVNDSSVYLPMPKAVAFTAPDDGWILAWRTRTGSSGSTYPFVLFHYGRRGDGSLGWSGCGDPATAFSADTCESPGPGKLGPVPKDAGVADLVGLVAAGDRTYLYGSRAKPIPLATGGSIPIGSAPLILYHERGRPGWSDGGGIGGLDEARPDATGAPRDPRLKGFVTSLSVAQRADGGWSGWAVGGFSKSSVPRTTITTSRGGALANTLEPGMVLLKLGGPIGAERWAPFHDPGALEDYLLPRPIDTQNLIRYYSEPSLQVTVGGLAGSEAPAFIGQVDGGRVFSFDPRRQRFVLVRSGQSTGSHASGYGNDGMVQALGSDGRGGVWMASTIPGFIKKDWAAGGRRSYFTHVTDRPRVPVFDEVAYPLGDGGGVLSALAGGADGTVWVGAGNGQLARYRRALGWEPVRVTGWDPGRVVTRPSAIHAIAVGADGSGLAVGAGGRIAGLRPGEVQLDLASGRSCSRGAGAPCSTGRDLRAVAVAPGGTALAGGDGLALLWRGPDGMFSAIEPPDFEPSTVITGIAMPRADRAWLAASNGYIAAGTLQDGRWRWRIENVTPTREAVGLETPLRAIAVDADGHGYAVGDRGVVLERTADSRFAWRWLRGPGTDHLTAVALAGADGGGALIGGANGVVWTVDGDRIMIARPADYQPDRATPTGPVISVALVPGVKDGQAEAWVGVGEGMGDAGGVTSTSRLWHYASDPTEPLLNPTSKALALPDAVAPREGEIGFAAFGKSDCELPSEVLCPEAHGTTELSEVIQTRIVDELSQRARDGQLGFALFTGDLSDTMGSAGSGVIERNRIGNVMLTEYPQIAYADLKPKRWAELVANPLTDGGLAVWATLGPGDLTRPEYAHCGYLAATYVDTSPCQSSTEATKTGDNAAWRRGLASQASPWGTGGDLAAGDHGLGFAEVLSSRRDAQPLPDVKADPNPAGEQIVRPVSVPGGARTHYAVDVLRGGRVIARVVTVDSSLRSLATGDPVQQPIERSGQQAWLERMICETGKQTATGQACTKPAGVPSIVLSNTPTYSYGPGALDGTATDQVALESVLLRHEVSAVVSGRLGWNARYWATAPGLHEPCVGGAYQDTPPVSQVPDCGATGQATQPALTATSKISTVLQGLGAPNPPQTANPTTGLTGVLPFVVASGAGGKFGPHGEQQQGSAADGYWHGYSIVRVPADGDPRGVLVEQRPILDWISLQAATHVLRPGQRLTLHGSGREPIGVRMPLYQEATTRYDEISTPAITHRYDLLEADPHKPWQPKVVDGNDNPHGYVSLDPTIATIDSQTGTIHAGRTNHPRIDAIALLSVGDKAATWPMTFMPKRSYTAPTVRLSSPPGVPEVRVLGFNAASVQPPTTAPPAATPPPINTTLQIPTPPAIPTFPTATPFSPPPPAPPAPPAPPSGQASSGLTLSINPTGITVPPTTGVAAQPTPPVNPSPPGGARKEAKQHQASAAKSEEGASEGAREGAGDPVNGPPGPGHAYTRRNDPLAFTAHRSHAQASAWTAGLEWGGGIGLMALALALGYTTVRPTPRRRPPVVPAPAWSWRRHT